MTAHRMPLSMPLVQPRPRVGDGFMNLVSALGAANTKIAANQYVIDVDPMQLVAAYRVSPWFKKVCRIPVDDSVSKWRAWQASPGEIEAIEKFERQQQVRLKVRSAFLQARVFGGAVIIPGPLPGIPSEPLDLERVGKGSIRYLTVLNRYEIAAQGVINDPMSPDHGKPQRYQVTPAGGSPIDIHPSRVVLINGDKAPSQYHSVDVWGDSLWLHLRDAITASDAAPAIIHALLHEAKTDVVRQEGLMSNMVSAEYEKLLIRRYQIAAQLKSVGNTLILDKEDEWDQKQINFSGLPGVAEMFLTVLAGAADIPVTRLVGTAAKGLNATGDGDLRNYYDAVRSRQELDIEPALSLLDEITIRSALGKRPEEIWYQWRPLWEPTRKERAEVDKMEAETVNIYAGAAVVPSEALEKAAQNRMIESGSWPGLEKAIEEAPKLEDEPTDDPDMTDPNDDRDTAAVGDARPMTLYVSRKVVNTAEIRRWAEAQGFTDIVPDLHVTIIRSSTPVDWIKVGEAWEEKLTVPKGGPRLLEEFNGGAKVLQFASQALGWRHDAMIEKGAVSDYPEFQPHITITYGPMPAGAQPYTGQIVLGPEIFEEVKP